MFLTKHNTTTGNATGLITHCLMLLRAFLVTTTAIHMHNGLTHHCLPMCPKHFLLHYYVGVDFRGLQGYGFFADLIVSSEQV